MLNAESKHSTELQSVKDQYESQVSELKEQITAM